MKWIKDGISANETKFSTLVVAFLASMVFALWQIKTIGEISDNLLTLLGYLIMAITGINVAEKISKPNKKDDYEIGE